MPLTDYERTSRWAAKHPEAIKAQHRLHWAKKRGDVTPPERCERCGRKVRLDAHHPDHSKPLEVEWICRLCHRSESVRPRWTPAPDQVVGVNWVQCKYCGERKPPEPELWHSSNGCADCRREWVRFYQRERRAGHLRRNHEPLTAESAQ